MFLKSRPCRRKFLFVIAEEGVTPKRITSLLILIVLKSGQCVVPHEPPWSKQSKNSLHSGQNLTAACIVI